MQTYAQRLHRRLLDVVDLNDRLLEVSAIDHQPHRMLRFAEETGFAAFVPDALWQPLDDEGRRRQREVIGRWRSVLEQLRLMFAGDAEHSRQRLDEAAARVAAWLERNEIDHSLPNEIGGAGRIFRKHVAPLLELLAPFVGDGSVVVVPDTNVLLRNQDLPSWSEVVGTSRYTVLLVAGVLAELDEQKLGHRVESVRDKARSFSSRIQGWRNQGSLAQGVKVQGDVVVRVMAREPDFERTLSWLDSSVVDDRIIASVLEFQRANPMCDVRLLSGDAIMLAKADEADVPTGDVPDRG